MFVAAFLLPQLPAAVQSASASASMVVAAPRGVLKTIVSRIYLVQIANGLKSFDFIYVKRVIK